jgi:hypothetical protein
MGGQWTGGDGGGGVTVGNIAQEFSGLEGPGRGMMRSAFGPDQRQVDGDTVERLYDLAKRGGRKVDLSGLRKGDTVLTLSRELPNQSWLGKIRGVEIHGKLKVVRYDPVAGNREGDMTIYPNDDPGSASYDFFVVE